MRFADGRKIRALRKNVSRETSATGAEHANLQNNPMDQKIGLM
jgi:hypothetical protein